MSFSKRLFLNNVIGHFGFLSKPNFIIVGAQKAGTSALFEILNQHSRINGSIHKELNYFDNDKLFGKRKLSNYHKKFPLSYQIPNDSLLFEATPEYLYHPMVAQRIAEYNPKMKIIIVLRTPIERAISAWTMYHHHFKNGVNEDAYDFRSFHDAIKEELNSINDITIYNNFRGYVKRGIYHEQIKQYLKHFPLENILFIESNELKNEFKSTLSKVLLFLEVPYENIENKTTHQSKVKPLSFDEERVLLKEFYSPHNQKLFQLIGKEYAW